MAIRLDNGVAFAEGPLTLEQATNILAEGNQAISDGVIVFDLAAITQVDSCALSLLLSWRRLAQARSIALTFRNIPESVHSLAGLYGLAELLA